MTTSPKTGILRIVGWIGVFASLLCVSVRAEAYGYVFATFKGDDAAGMKLSIYTSADALDFTLLSDTGFGGPIGYLRDPSIMKYADGKYYVAYTDPPTASCCGKADHFSIASSADLIHWTNLTTVSAGVPGVAHTWAPEWFIEGSTVHVTANIDTLNTDSDFKPYLFTALDSALTTWSAPVPLGFGPNYIDAFVLKVGSTYHAFAKNETTRYCEHATASNLTGPWTFVGTGNWAQWGSGMEGPAVVQLDDGTWRIFLDGQGSTPFVTATSPDLNAWSAWVALPNGLGSVVRHGTVVRDVALGGTLSDGGTFDGDGAAVDARSSTDAGGGTDARIPEDAEADGDASVPADSGSPADARAGKDARPAADGGSPRDSSSTEADRGSTEDGSSLEAGRGDGTVASVADSSVDGGGTEERGVEAASDADGQLEMSNPDSSSGTEDGLPVDGDLGGSHLGGASPSGCSCRATRSPGGSLPGAGLLGILVVATGRRWRKKRM